MTTAAEDATTREHNADEQRTARTDALHTEE
jgi:hypothetical protein